MLVLCSAAAAVVWQDHDLSDGDGGGGSGSGGKRSALVQLDVHNAWKRGSSARRASRQVLRHVCCVVPHRCSSYGRECLCVPFEHHPSWSSRGQKIITRRLERLDRDTVQNKHPGERGEPYRTFVEELVLTKQQREVAQRRRLPPGSWRAHRLMLIVVTPAVASLPLCSAAFPFGLEFCAVFLSHRLLPLRLGVDVVGYRSSFRNISSAGPK